MKRCSALLLVLVAVMLTGNTFSKVESATLSSDKTCFGVSISDILEKRPNLLQTERVYCFDKRVVAEVVERNEDQYGDNFRTLLAINVVTQEVQEQCSIRMPEFYSVSGIVVNGLESYAVYSSGVQTYISALKWNRLQQCSLNTEKANPMKMIVKNGIESTKLVSAYIGEENREKKTRITQVVKTYYPLDGAVRFNFDGYEFKIKHYALQVALKAFHIGFLKVALFKVLKAQSIRYHTVLSSLTYLSTLASYRYLPDPTNLLFNFREYTFLGFISNKASSDKDADLSAAKKDDYNIPMFVAQADMELTMNENYQTNLFILTVIFFLGVVLSTVNGTIRLGLDIRESRVCPKQRWTDFLDEHFGIGFAASFLYGSSLEGLVYIAINFYSYYNSSFMKANLAMAIVAAIFYFFTYALIWIGSCKIKNEKGETDLSEDNVSCCSTKRLVLPILGRWADKSCLSRFVAPVETIRFIALAIIPLFLGVKEARDLGKNAIWACVGVEGVFMIVILISRTGINCWEYLMDLVNQILLIGYLIVKYLTLTPTDLELISNPQRTKDFSKLSLYILWIYVALNTVYAGAWVAKLRLLTLPYSEPYPKNALGESNISFSDPGNTYRKKVILEEVEGLEPEEKAEVQEYYPEAVQVDIDPVHSIIGADQDGSYL